MSPWPSLRPERSISLSVKRLRRSEVSMTAASGLAAPSTIWIASGPIASRSISRSSIGQS
jgi:hypothetical protein